MAFGRENPLHPHISQDPNFGNDIYAATIQMNIAPGDTYIVQMVTAVSVYRLIDLDVNFLNGEVDFSCFESAIVGDGTFLGMGGAVDRTLTKPSTMAFYKNPTTFIAPGDPLMGITHFGIESDVSNFGAVEVTAVEYITFKKDTTYLFTFKNPSLTETVNNLHFKLLWAE